MSTQQPDSVLYGTSFQWKGRVDKLSTRMSREPLTCSLAVALAKLDSRIGIFPKIGMYRLMKNHMDDFENSFGQIYCISIGSVTR